MRVKIPKINIWIKSYKLQAKDVLPNVNRKQAAEWAKKCRFCPWWPWPLTFDLDLQTCPSEGANTFSVWI